MNQYTSVEAFAPASMGNVGIGFDMLGLAYTEPGDIVRVERCEKPGAFIASITGDDGRLPLDADKNTASIAVNSMLSALGDSTGISIIINKGLPLASGLGSSAASAVAAVVATNTLLGEPFSRRDLLPFCIEGEAAVSGYHADNVGPCLLGGIMLIGGTTPDQLRHLPVPDNLHLALVTPGIEVPTIEARAALPTTIPLKKMISQTVGVAQAIDALYCGDLSRFAEAVEKDDVVEPARAHLMPRLDEARAKAKSAGAMALVISGAGPSLCAVCDTSECAQQVVDALCSFYQDANLSVQGWATRVDMQGARILKAL